MLTTESFNALLKTLEEPPEHVVFILATTEVHKLPATILSRTQRHTFKLYPEDQIAAHLKKIAKKENIDIDNEAIQLLARHGNGSFRDSISLLDQLSSQESKVTAETVELLLGVAQSSQLVNLTNAMQNGDTAAVMNGVGTLLDSGLTPSGIASQLAIHIRDQIVAGNNTALVSLLGDLLTVHGSANQQLTLESILLRATVGQLPQSPAKATSASSITSPQKTAKVSQVTAKSQKKAPSENSSSNPQAQSTTTSPLPSDFVIDEAWPKILAAVEAQNKPLYTVLRLAHPSVNKGKLAIAFAFEFHQKRVDDAKHKAIIASCLSQVTGHSAGVETVLDKSLGTPDTVILQQSSPQPDPAHASVIAGIQDIMGGGEVVNV